MSEKQVNIKITASTKDFNNAIDKAQKQIENLAEAIDKLSSSKFGDKLEEQFDGLVKTIKKIEEQMTDMMDSLNDLGKAKFDKIEDQFKDIVDSGKDVNEKIEDILDLLDKVDRQDLNGLEKEFDQVRDSLEQLSKETRDSTDTMEKSFREITDEVDKFIKELNSVEDTKLENLEESIKDLDKYVDEAAESVDDFNKKTNDLDDKELNDYLDSLIDITRAGDDARDALKKAFGSLDGKSGKLDFDLSGKGKDGALSSIAEGLISGTVAGNKLEKAMEGVADSISDVAKNMEKLDDATDTKSIDELGEEYRKAENAMEKLTEEYDDLAKKQEELTKSQEEFKNSNDLTNKAIALAEENMYKYAEQAKELDKALEKAKEAQLAYTEDSNKLEAQLTAVTDAIEKQKKAYSESEDVFVDAEEKYDDLRKTLDVLNKEYDELRETIANAHKAGDGETTEKLVKDWTELGKTIQDVKEKIKQANKVMEDEDDKQTDILNRIDALEKERETIEKQKNALDEAHKIIGKTEEEIEQMTEAWQDANKKAEEFQDLMTKLRQVDINEAIDMEFVKENFKKTTEEAEKLKKQMEETAEAMAEMNKVAQGHADEFDKQYKAYEKLRNEVEAYLEDEKNGILLREKVAKSFKQVADSMEAVYKDSSKLNNFDDLVNKTLEEAAEHVKDLNLVSTENLQADLNRLGEIIEDKTEKIKRFKELNKEFGSDASKAAAGLDKRAKDIRDWANSADFAIDAADKLTHAWGDLSAAGKDHLKIRERAKYIEDFGEALEKNVAQIKNYYHTLETLDDIYKECTDKQRATIDDYKMWEKNKEKLLEYNRAINEYMRTLRDTGGQIDAKFLDELGNFSPQKFIDNFEKMGASSVVLQKQINAVKIELIESIKQYKENAEAARENAEQAVRNAKAALEQAKANQKNADSQEEYLEATERVKKAQEELAEAKKKAKNYDDETLKNLKDQIQEYNRLAAAMREIGMAAQDLGKADIAKFNKSLASMLDNLKTFENDLPKTFADLGEDIKAVFMDMDSLDLGDALDGLKDIGAGLFAAIPTELKVALGVATAIGVALKESAEMGIEHFSRGASTISNALSGIIGVARNIGQEIRDAFENITGMQLDASSLMEIPVNFEAQMQRVKAIGEMTEEEFKRINDLAIQLGADTVYGATEVGQAMEYMGQAGWETDQIEKGVAAVLDLATVADMDLGKAAETVTDIINAFKNAGKNSLTADDASMVADLLNTAAVKTSTSIEQLKSSFSNVAPIAGSFNMSIRDLAMGLGLMGNQGVKGAKAGTALKNIITNMNRPTEEQLLAMKKYNLLGARKAMIDGDLLGGIRQMQKALGGLSESERNQVIEIIAGQEALSGVSALLNSTEEDINKLEAAMNDCTGSAHNMAEEFKKTVKGALDDLAGSIESTLLKVFNEDVQEKIAGVINQISEFFNILSGFEQSSSGLTGIAGAMEHLEETTRGWGEAIEEGITKAIGAINDFINSESFDNLLQAGTNIINSIADGIKNAADNGTLGNAISTAIGKIATWFSENLDTIVAVGKEVIDAISQGISENQGAIGEVIRSVIDMQTTIDTAIAKEKWKLIGANLGTFIVEGFTSKVATFFSGVGGFLSGLVSGGGGGEGNLKKKDDNSDMLTTEDGGWTFIPNKYTGGQWVYTGKKNGEEYAEGVKKGVNSKKEDISNTIDNNFKNAKPKTDATAASIGQGISDNIVKKLETMDTGDLKALRQEMQALQKTVSELGTGMATSFTQIRESSRENFMNLANIVRSQMTNVANIVINQTKNARNALTTQFMSMEAVARTQTGKVYSTVRSNTINWANIISNQSKNARDNLTRWFMSMASVVSTQMKKCLDSVNSYMSKISKATNKNMSMNLNVNRNISTSYAAAAGASVISADALYAANAASTYSLGRNMSALASRASSAVSSEGTTFSSGGSRGSGNGMTIEVPVKLDGREIARATAKYTDEELKTIASRENRKRGGR